jgi:hypothetical protein
MWDLAVAMYSLVSNELIEFDVPLFLLATTEGAVKLLFLEQRS